MSYTNGEDVVERYTYTYDKNDRIVTEHIVNSYTEIDELREYTYDSVGNLVTFDISGTTELTTTYEYDQVGNRVKKISNETVVYSYNGLNQLVQENNGEITTYLYDNNGNQISKKDANDVVIGEYVYTPSGMLESYTHNNDIQDNLYNGEGKRVSKVETVGETTDSTRYYYQDGSVLRTTDAEGTMKSFNLLNVSDVFATSRDNTLGDKYYFYTEDIRGSKTNLIDSNASNVVSYWYSDFGEVTEVKGTNYNDFVNEIQYTGAIYDKFSGLTYLNARFYDASTGRFISQDSYRGERNDADTWHLYLYCANDPINYVDPSGHFTVKRIHVAIPIDIIVATFGGIVGIMGHFNKLKMAASKLKKYNGKIRITTNKINVVLKYYRHVIKKYEHLMRKVGNTISRLFVNHLWGIKMKSLGDGSKFIGKLLSESAKAGVDFIINNKILKEITKDIPVWMEFFSSVGGCVSVIFDKLNNWKIDDNVFTL